MAESTEAPSDAAASLGAEIEDEFGPPHAQQVSDTLQVWILVPGLILLLILVGKYGPPALGSVVGSFSTFGSFDINFCVYMYV